MSLRQKIIQSAFLRQVSRLGFGVILAQVIAIGISPFLTRLYTPDELGYFALFGSLVLILSLISTGSYDVAVTLPKQWQNAFSLVSLSFMLTLLFGVILIPVVLILNVFNIVDLPDLFLNFLIPGVLLHSWMTIANTWNLRTETFHAISNGRILQSGSMGGVQLLGGMGGLGVGGLLLGHLVGRAVNLAYLIYQRMDDMREGWKLRGDISLPQTAKAYIRQPRFVLLSSLLSTGSTELPIILISILFNDVQLGLFGLAIRVLMSPVNAVTYAFGNVYFQRISKSAQERARIFPTLRNMWGLLAGIGAIPFTLLCLYSEPLFSTAFGTEWTEAGTIASIMAPMLFLSFLFTPSSRTMMVLGKEHIMPLFSSFSLVMNATTLLVGGLFFDFYSAIIAMSAGQCLIFILYIGYTYAIVKSYDKSLTLSE